MQEISDYTGCNIIDNNECKVSEVSKIFFGTSSYGIINFERMILKNEKKVARKLCTFTRKKCYNANRRNKRCRKRGGLSSH